MVLQVLKTDKDEELCTAKVLLSDGVDRSDHALFYQNIKDSFKPTYFR